jgi:hypothetical protein
MKKNFAHQLTVWAIIVVTMGSFSPTHLISVLYANTSEVQAEVKAITPLPSETIIDTNTEVRIRQHPKTGQPYVSIVPRNNPDEKRIPFKDLKPVSRPDYRMLDYKTKSGEIPYDGPASNRAKVYVFAATLAATGVAGGLLLPIAPATGAAASGAGILTGAGATVAASTVAAAVMASRPDPKRDNFQHGYEARFLEITQGKKIPVVEKSTAA